MAAGSLPGEGEALVGGVALPAGYRVAVFLGEDNPVEPFAWVTEEAVSDAGSLWSALGEVRGQTGLIPVLVDSPDDLTYYDEDFGSLRPANPAFLTGENILAARWSGRAGSSRPFPGLSLGGDSQLSKADVSDVLAGIGPAWVALVPAERPADVLETLRWVVFDDFLDYATPDEEQIAPGVWMAPVLRSWEDRFGAHLLKVGPGATIRLLVERPPASFDSAQLLAAEHFAFADEQHDLGGASIEEIAEALVGKPVWQFWWD